MKTNNFILQGRKLKLTVKVGTENIFYPREINKNQIYILHTIIEISSNINKFGTDYNNKEQK
jgi:hypothetical protein